MPSAKAMKIATEIDTWYAYDPTVPITTEGIRLFIAAKIDEAVLRLRKIAEPDHVLEQGDLAELEAWGWRP